MSFDSFKYKFFFFAFKGYYKRTPAYMPIRRRERLGCFAVPMVHSTYLLDLQKEASRELAFYPPHPEYSWALDDVIIFAYSARMAGETGRQTSDPVAKGKWVEGLSWKLGHLLSSVPQVCRCTCATRRLMVIFPSRCLDTPTCRTRPRASFIRSLRLWVSQLSHHALRQTDDFITVATHELKYLKSLVKIPQNIPNNQVELEKQNTVSLLGRRKAFYSISFVYFNELIRQKQLMLPLCG